MMNAIGRKIIDAHANVNDHVHAKRLVVQVQKNLLANNFICLRVK